MTTKKETFGRPRVGVSRCLMGDAVRYDGSHCRDRFVLDRLRHHVDLVPVCPEVEFGLPVPRDTLRLVDAGSGTRLVTLRTGEDHTEAMRRWAVERVEALDAERLDGFILKQKSPSCGLSRVRVYDDSGHAERVGTGLFAGVLAETRPELALTEEGWLNDERLRETFLVRIFSSERLRRTVEREHRFAALLDFHARHKLLFMAHSPAHYRSLGRMVADGKHQALPALERSYAQEAMKALAVRTSRGKHTNVLQHIFGFFKRAATQAEKNELLAAIESYAVGHLPLAVPVALLRHQITHHGVEGWLPSQVYFEPFPIAIGLR